MKEAMIGIEIKKEDGQIKGKIETKGYDNDIKRALGILINNWTSQVMEKPPSRKDSIKMAIECLKSAEDLTGEVVRRTFAKDGKDLELMELHGTLALIKGWNEYTPYVCTHYFDEESCEWSHGHYFETESDARAWYKEQLKEM